jgi:DNA-binding XRE family transcriptional regulator
MDSPHPPSDELRYAIWINDRIRAELKRRRLALGVSPYALAIPRKLTAQTIRNIERGTHSPSIRTAGLLCQRLGTTFDREVNAAHLATAIAGTSANSNGVVTLGLTLSNPPTRAEMRAIANKWDELILAQRR